MNKSSIAVIFDMDGLMLDTERLSMSAWQAASVEIGHPLDEDICKGMIGLGQAEADRYLADHFGDEERARSLESAAKVIYAAAMARDGVPSKAGLFDLLNFLDANHVPKAVATSTPTVRATDKLSRAGVLPYFDLVIAGDRVTRGKPAPDIYLLAASELGYPPAQCVVLEDSGPGIRSATAAGMRVIFVPDICNVNAATQQLAFATAASLSDAQTILEGLLNP